MSKLTRTVWRIFRIGLFIYLICVADLSAAKTHGSGQSRRGPAGNENKGLLMTQVPQGIILGRPTSNSITADIYASNDSIFYLEYGTNNSKYGARTTTCTLSAGQVKNINITQLKPDSIYYYRLCSKTSDSNEFCPGPQYTFHTARPKGSSFCFVVQADSHLDEQSSTDLYKQTLVSELSEQPDFVIDLGDTFMTDKLRPFNRSDMQTRYLMQRGYFSLISHSVPLFLVLGNHDGEAGWLLDGTDESMAVLSVKARKTYFPNPEADNFYTGNIVSEKLVGPLQDYYAWTWGDALFVVLDPYWYTPKKPRGTVENWEWTLGETQYRWFKKTLEGSNAKFKFVFCHQLIGGEDDGRGGVEFAKYYEMGGYNEDGTWGFNSKRPGWGKPIHQLMVDNKVNIFFHGHDHFFAKQELDGVIYQLVPQPSHPDSRYPNQDKEYGYTNGKILPSSGYMLIRVLISALNIEYLQIGQTETGNSPKRMVSYSYMVQH